MHGFRVGRWGRWMVSGEFTYPIDQVVPYAIEVLGAHSTLGPKETDEG